MYLPMVERVPKHRKLRYLLLSPRGSR